MAPSSRTAYPRAPASHKTCNLCIRDRLLHLPLWTGTGGHRTQSVFGTRGSTSQKAQNAQNASACYTGANVCTLGQSYGRVRQIRNAWLRCIAYVRHKCDQRLPLAPAARIRALCTPQDRRRHDSRLQWVLLSRTACLCMMCTSRTICSTFWSVDELAIPTYCTHERWHTRDREHRSRTGPHTRRCRIVCARGSYGLRCVLVRLFATQWRGTLCMPRRCGLT